MRGTSGLKYFGKQRFCVLFGMFLELPLARRTVFFFSFLTATGKKCLI